MDIKEKMTPETTIRMIEAFLTAFRQSERKGVAAQIYNAMFTIGYAQRDPAAAIKDAKWWEFLKDIITTKDTERKAELVRIKREIEKKSLHWEGQSINDKLDGREPTPMITIEGNASWWQELWEG